MPTDNKHPVTMLFKCPGPHVWEGMAHDYVVVPDAEIEAKLAEGWHLTVQAADAVHKDSVEQHLAENEAEQADIAAKLESAGEGVEDAPAAPKLTPLHKGRGVWSLVDADGNEVKTGLTKEQAHA